MDLRVHPPGALAFPPPSRRHPPSPRLGDPLGIEALAWTRVPQGYHLGGNEMALSPRAMVAFVEIYRTGGAGVLSPGWVAASFSAAAVCDRRAPVGCGHSLMMRRERTGGEISTN